MHISLGFVPLSLLSLWLETGWGMGWLEEGLMLIVGTPDRGLIVSGNGEGVVGPKRQGFSWVGMHGSIGCSEPRRLGWPGPVSPLPSSTPDPSFSILFSFKRIQSINHFANYIYRIPSTWGYPSHLYKVFSFLMSVSEKPDFWPIGSLFWQTTFFFGTNVLRLGSCGSCGSCESQRLYKGGTQINHLGENS